MHISLIVPAPFDTISGGYGYDRRIVQELRAAGHGVDVVELAGAFPAIDDFSRDSACAAWDRLPAGTRPVIDGLALPAFQGLDDAIAARNVAGLIHHPLSLETGLAADVQTRLDRIERRLFPRLSRLIVTSETTAGTMTRQFLIPEDRIRAVVPGTDDLARSAGSSGDGTREIVAIGTLIPRKGHDLLLRALARLWDLDWHLTIVGSPEPDPVHAGGLLALAADLNIERRVRFAGQRTGEELEAIWRAADIFALATHYEGFGMAIAEALKRGLPVVVANGGAAGQLVTPDSGCLCPVGDFDQVSKALRRLIFDDGLRRGMAEAAWHVGQSLPAWKDQAALFARSLG